MLAMFSEVIHMLYSNGIWINSIIFNILHVNKKTYVLDNFQGLVVLHTDSVA